MKKLKVLLLIPLIPIIILAQTPIFKFTPDSGIRVDSAAIAHATLVNDTLFLFYNHQLFDGRQARDVCIATKSSDWLNFKTDSIQYKDYEDYFIRYKMPDSVYRKFYPQGKDIFSKSSQTGYNFIADTGIRYTLQPFDSVLGVSTYISAKDGTVHLFYNTTGQSYIACRHAISYDKGWTFNFVDGNVFGDSLEKQTGAFVDPNGVLNNDGSISVYLMNQHNRPLPPAGRTGYIHSFTSYDNGKTFTIDKDEKGDSIRFKFDDFDNVPGFNNQKVYSLNDPKVVKLPDGRYRVYVSAILKDTSGNLHYAIVSATSSKKQTNIRNKKHLSNIDIKIFPNPSKGNITIQASKSNNINIKVYDILGRLVYNKLLFNKKSLKIKLDRSGIYFIRIKIQNKTIIKKFIIL